VCLRTEKSITAPVISKRTDQLDFYHYSFGGMGYIITQKSQRAYASLRLVKG